MRTQHASLNLILMLLFLSGCTSTGTIRPQSTVESQKEAVSAMGKVLSHVSGADIDEKKLRQLNNEIQKDPEAKSAVESIANTMRGPQGGQVIKYCPVDGQRYGSKFTECPEHNVPLKILNE